MLSIFIILFFFLLYSYFIFPQSLLYASAYKLSNDIEEVDRKVVVLISMYNEEKSIENTIHHIISSEQSSMIDKIYLGDDGSTDNTIIIIDKLQTLYPKIVIDRFSRIGKPNVIKSIVEKYDLASSDYTLVMMDANIVWDRMNLKNIIEKLKYKEVGIVGSSVLPSNESNNLESEYIQRENKIKNEESRVTGYAIGMFGSCYAMKGEYYQPIPSRFITDDLFHTFSVVGQNQKAIFLSSAKVFENITADVVNEFNRKKRYAAGNFQILIHFWKLLLPWNSSRGFVYCYFFHKIVRWVAPVLFFTLWLSSLFSSEKWIGVMGTIVLIFMFVNYLFQKNNQKPLGFRLFYFLSMNWAILLGFVNFLKGIKTNVWERSERF